MIDSLYPVYCTWLGLWSGLWSLECRVGEMSRYDVFWKSEITLLLLLHDMCFAMMSRVGVR